MNISPSKAKRLALSLRRENRKNGRSWRTIAREDFHGSISHATLHRFAISKGTWIPKDEHILIVLGLITPRKLRPQPISGMSVCELLRALREREPMPTPSRQLITAMRARGYTWLKFPRRTS